jgi:uncharacterized protein
MILGVLLVILGIVGIFIPVIPTTPSFLAATWCFMKTSDRLYHWILYNRLFGKYLRNYVEGKGIPITIKIFLITLCWLMLAYSILYIFNNVVIDVMLVIIGVAITVQLLIEKTYKKDRNEIH